MAIQDSDSNHHYAIVVVAASAFYSQRNMKLKKTNFEITLSDAIVIAGLIVLWVSFYFFVKM